MALLPVVTVPLSLVWEAVARIRGWLFDCGVLKSESFACPVICVGNLAVGGTGKTPHVEYVLRLLHAEGYRTAMLSRGYGRKTRGYLLADDTHTAADIGDEPFQIRQNCPFATVAVCEKRVTGIRRLLQMQPAPDVIVLDDAYQHRYVKAGLNVLLTDARRLYTHDHLLPWGRLREPASAARRADVIVVTKCREEELPALPVEEGQTLCYSRICYAPLQPLCGGDGETVAADAAHAGAAENAFAGRRVLLVAGIANPAPLAEYIRTQGARSVEVLAFPDHHDFCAADAVRINGAWQQVCAGNSEEEMPMAVTTQKDAVRIGTIWPHFGDALKRRFYVQPITVKFIENENKFNTFNLKIQSYVRNNQRNSRVD